MDLETAFGSESTNNLGQLMFIAVELGYRSSDGAQKLSERVQARIGELGGASSAIPVQTPSMEQLTALLHHVETLQTELDEARRTIEESDAEIARLRQSAARPYPFSVAHSEGVPGAQKHDCSRLYREVRPWAPPERLKLQFAVNGAEWCEAFWIRLVSPPRPLCCHTRSRITPTVRQLS